MVEVETGKTLQRLSGHTEVVVAVAWRPHSEEIATGSLDKTVRFWNAQTGTLLKTLKDHADAISSVAYSDDGTRFASGSADRSAKVYRAEDGKRMAVLNAHQDGITRVAFRPKTKQLITVGADKTARVWSLEKMPVENPDRVQYEDSIINACAFSPDGSLFAWGAVSDCVRLFNGDASQQKLAFKEPEDWVYAVAIASDNDTLAAGTQDGKIYFWSAKANRRLRTVTLSPKEIRVEEAKP
jgi:WD40 repeat protein